MATAATGLVPRALPPRSSSALRLRGGRGAGNLLLVRSHLVTVAPATTSGAAIRLFPDGLTSSSSRSNKPRTRRRKKAPFFSPVMEWQDCSAEMKIDVPCSIAYECYSDRESIPLWMPFISSVKVLEDKPDLSRWSLRYEVFGQDVQFSWLARNLQPIRNQKIHWRSLEGLQNRGAVRFYPKGPNACKVELTISYEVPQILTPFASALRPFLEGLLKQGLEQFATVAKSYQSKISS